MSRFGNRAMPTLSRDWDGVLEGSNLTKTPIMRTPLASGRRKIGKALTSPLT
jgi:hypothetical protein